MVKSIRGRRFMTGILPALLSGLLLTAAFPRPGLSWLAWVALTPLIFSLRGLSDGRSFVVGFIAGWAHFLTLGYWLIPTMMTYGGVPLAAALSFYLILAACLAVYVGLFALFLSWVSGPPLRAMTAAPFIWVGLEYLRTHLFTGLPWELLGYSQFESLCLIQAADIAGVYGLSFMIVLVNAAAATLMLALSRRDWRGMPVRTNAVALMTISVMLLLGITCGYGHWRLRTIAAALSNAPVRTIAVVQGNIDQARKWDFEFRLASVRKYLGLARTTVEAAPDLIVLPETALPFYFLYEKSLTDMVTQGARDTGASILAGAPSFQQVNGAVRYYNSAFLINPAGEVTDRYDKTHLVPLGEYVPFGQWLPFIDKLVAGVGDFSPGTADKVLSMNGCRLGVQICYEIIFPGICRRMVNKGADIIINITNDAWYGRTGAPYQHFSMTVLRAVETRRSLVRSANTGISGFVDPAGRVRGSTGLFVESTPVYRVPVMTGRTVYSRTGDILAKFCVFLLLFVLWKGGGKQLRVKWRNRFSGSFSNTL